MRHRLVVGFGLGLALAACGYEKLADLTDDAGHTIDGPATGSDAAVACTPSTTTCTSGQYVECSPTGVPAVTLACPLGCDATQPKCRDVNPSNGVAQYLDQTRTDSAVVAVTLGDGSTISTDTGVVFDGATSVAVPNIDIGEYHVFMVKSLSITGATVVSGADGIIIVSDGDVSISGLLDVSATGTTSGPGGGAGTCLGGTAVGTSGGPAGGGGGGGNGDAGGTGGNANGNGSPGGTPGPALADLDLEPLHGGCAGGDSKRNAASMCRGIGGGGGGALQIVSRTQIALTGGGVIDASGGGGAAARAGIDTCFSTSLNGGGGGGAGGSVLLEAPQILLQGSSVTISTAGGGGASGGVSNPSAYNGSDGGTDGTSAVGGTNATTGVSGGRGGTEGLLPGSGTAGDTNEDGGGAGGAVGRVRFNDTAGAINPTGGATIRTKQSSSVLRTRLVP